MSELDLLESLRKREELGTPSLSDLTQAPPTGQSSEPAPTSPLLQGADPSLNVDAALDDDPDEYAKDVSTSRRTGYPVESIRGDVDLVRDVRKEDTLTALGSGPSTEAWFAEDPGNATMAIDDVPLLVSIEEVMGQGYADEEGPLGYFGAASSGVDVIQGSASSVLETLGEATGIEELRQYGEAGRKYNEQQQRERGHMQSITGAESVGDVGQGILELAGNQTPIIGLTMGSAGLGGYLGGALGALGGPLAPVTVPAGITVGAFLGGFLPSFMLMTGQAQSSLKERDPDAREPWAVWGLGAAGGALEMLTPGTLTSKALNALHVKPIDVLADVLATKGAGYIAKRTGIEVGKGTLREGFTELGQDTLVEYGTAYLTDQEVDWEQFGPQALESFVAGAIMGAGMSGATTPFTENIRINKAQAYRDNVVDVVDKARNSALRDRSPEVFQNYMAALAKDTGRETLAINANPVVEYLASQGVDPIDVFAELGVDRKTLNDAYESGGDVNVGMAEFVTKMADSEHLETLLTNARQDPKAATMAEAEVLKAEVSGAIDAAVKEAKALLEGQTEGTVDPSEAADRIATEVAKQVKATKRYTAAGARDIGEMFGAFANTVAQAYAAEGKDFDIEGFFTEMGLRVESGVFNAQQTADAELNAVERVTEDPLMQNGPWMEETVTAMLEDGTTHQLLAGEARDILVRRENAAQALLECVSASA